MPYTFEFRVEVTTVHTYHVTSDIDANSASIALNKFLRSNRPGTSSPLRSIEHKGAEEASLDVYIDSVVHK